MIKVKRLARNLSSRIWFWKKLPARYGGRRVLISPSSHLSYWTKSLDVVHSDIFAGIDRVVRPGHCVWDIGANVGAVSVAASRLTGEKGYVLGVEADNALIQSLRCSAMARDESSAQTEIFPVAVSDKVGVVRFNISSFATATNAIEGFGRFPGVKQVNLVPSVTLDWLAEHFRTPDVVKIDVEGAEVLVLRGGERLLSTVRPIFLIEVGPEVEAELRQILASKDYRFYRFDGHAIQDGASIAADILAVPAEKCDQVAKTN